MRPLRHIKPHCPKPFEAPPERPSGFGVACAIAAWAFFFFALYVAMSSTRPAAARDTTGLSETLTQEQRDWVRGLRSGQGVSCCDDADGIDPVWDIQGGRYRVRWEGQWLEVSPEALLTEPNRLGVARAWMGHMDGKPFVRCFLPGPVT